MGLEKKYIIKSVLFFLLFVGATTVFGQLKPEAFPEDVGLDEIQTRCYCKPGVRNKSRSRGLELSYGYNGPGTLKEESTAFTGKPTSFQNFQNFKLDAKIPIILKDGFKLLIGYKLFTERFKFNVIGQDFKTAIINLNQELLKNNSLSLIASKPLNETNYLVFRLGYSANGNYEQFVSLEKDFAIYKFTGFYGVKPSDDIEWGFGLNVSQSFRRFNVLPFFLYNRTFNSNWGIEAVLPAFAFARYNVAEKDIFLMGFEYSSKSYRLQNINPVINGFDDYAFNHSELIASVELEHKFLPWIWGSVKVGYNLNFSSQFEEKGGLAVDFDYDPSNNLFLNFGLFLSPPKM